MLDYKAIGRRIAFYRKKANMTQGSLAEKLDISDGYISQIERGSTKVSLARLDKIAEILDVNITLLISDKAIEGVNFFNSEIFEIIKEWDKEHIDVLVSLINCADAYFRNN